MGNFLKLLGFKNRKNTNVVENQESLEMDDFAKLLQKMLEDLKSKECNEELFKTTTYDSFYPKPNIHVEFDGFGARIKVNDFKIYYSDLSEKANKIRYEILDELMKINKIRIASELARVTNEINELYENN